MTGGKRGGCVDIRATDEGSGPRGWLSRLRRLQVSLDNRWVAEDAGRVAGILRELPVQQGFGGRFVASHGVGAVAVALEARSRGVGRELMSSFLRSMHERAVPLSVLYASTLAAYRPVGYELAGVRVRYEVPLEHLPRSQPLAVEPWDEDDLSEVDDCLNRIALANNGMMSRPDWWWQQNVFNPLDEDAYLYRYRVQEGNRTTGYLVYTSPHESRRDLPVHWTAADEKRTSVAARDLFWETPKAARSLLAFAAGQRALGTNLYWSGPPNDHTFGFIAEHLPRVQSSYQWMLRIVDIARAFEGRGFPPGIDTKVDFCVVDPIIEANNRGYRITVADGHARVDTIPSAAMTITVGGLAALYSGWLSPTDAVRGGFITGAIGADLATLTPLFAGPMPWMNEFF